MIFVLVLFSVAHATSPINLRTQDTLTFTWLETGFIYLDAASWRGVTTNTLSFSNPVVLASLPNIGKFSYDGFPASIRIRNRQFNQDGSFSFEMKIYLTNDSYCSKVWYTPQPVDPALQVSWMVAEYGAYDISNHYFIVGTGQINRTGELYAGTPDYVRVWYPPGCKVDVPSDPCEFPSALPTSSIGVIAQLQTLVYDRYLTIRLSIISRRFLRAVLDCHDSDDTSYYVMHAVETMGFIAYETGVTMNCAENLAFETARISITSASMFYTFAQNYAFSPGVFGLVVTVNSVSDHTTLRSFNRTSSNGYFITQEDQCRYESTVHTTPETGSIFVVGEISSSGGSQLCKVLYRSALDTPPPTNLPTNVPTMFPSAQPTFSPTTPPTLIPTFIPTSIPTFLPTALPTCQPSAIPTFPPTSLPTAVPTALPSFTPTVLPTAQPSALPTLLPTLAPSSAPTAFPTSLPTAPPTSVPSSSPTVHPTAIPSSLPSSTPTLLPTSPTPIPTPLPTVLPSSIPSPAPTVTPTALPSSTPTTIPIFVPTSMPTLIPTSLPTSQPSAIPTSPPTSLPTAVPTALPSITPTVLPTAQPSPLPTSLPTSAPSSIPTAFPTSLPSTCPTSLPTASPSFLPTSVPSSSPTVHPSSIPSSLPSSTPTSLPTSPPSSIPSSSPTVTLTALPSSVPTTIPSFVPTSVPSVIPTAASTERIITSSNGADTNTVLIAWSIPVSVVGSLLIVYAVVFNVRSQRRKLQDLQSKYASVSNRPNNNSNNGVANTIGPPVILGCDIDSDSVHSSAGSIELKIMDTPAVSPDVANSDDVTCTSDCAMTTSRTDTTLVGFQYEGDNADSTPLADPMISTDSRGGFQVPVIDTKIIDEDDDTRSSVSSISLAGLSLTTPKLAYNYDEDDDRVVVTLHTPIRNGMTSSGLAYVVRGAMNEGGVNASDVPIVVKFVPRKHAHVLQHELKQLLYVEEKIKRTVRFRNTIVQPLVSHLVSTDSTCELRQHNRDQEQMDKWIGIVLESGDRNVKQLLDDYPLPHHMQLSILADLLNALHILECCNVVHMDVKPTNIISSHLCCKLIDFDICLRRGKPIPIGGLWTARYSAPEIAKHRRDGGTLLSDHKMDMWSFGMIAVEIFCGQDFWSLMGVSDDEIEYKLSRLTSKDIRLFLDQHVRNDEDAALRSVLMSTLVVNPVHRCAASAVLKRSYFNARDSTVVNRRAQVTEEIRETVVRISAKMDDVISILRSNEEMLTTLLTGRYMLPSLFVIVPSTKSEKSVFSFSLFRKAMLYEYRLYFICPITKQLAKCGPDGSGYEIRVPREWLIAAAPAIKFCLCAIKILISAYGIPPAMIPTLGADSWSSFGDTIQQCLRRDGGDAGERAFSSLEECFNDMTDASFETLSELNATLQNVTSQSFDQIAGLLQNAEGASKPVHASWRPKMTGLVEVTCRTDGSTLWVHESVAEQYRLEGKSLLLRLSPV